MKNLEQNNIQTQNSLMSDIISNYSGICYGVTERGKELMQLLEKKEYNKEDETFSLDKDTWHKVMEIANIFSDQRRFHALGILAKNGIPDNEIKLDILRQLKGQK